MKALHTNSSLFTLHIHSSLSIFTLHLNALKLPLYSVSDFLKLQWLELKLGVREQHILLALHRDEMNVRMRHLKSEHSLTYLFAREDTLYCHRHLLLTSSSCHPKIFVKEFSYFLMSCH